MPDRAIPLLKLLCAALAVLLVAQIARATARRNLLAHIEIPATPVWKPESATNAPAQSPGPAMAASAPGLPPGVALPPGALPPGMPTPPRAPGPRGGSRGGPNPPLPPEAQARLDRIVQSGLLGPVMKPPPMALLGIAGPDVFLRGPNGQTGIIREGQELGGAKLLRVGTNRVLVLEGGQEKELTIFEGLGGESLVRQTHPAQPQ